MMSPRKVEPLRQVVATRARTGCPPRAITRLSRGAPFTDSNPARSSARNDFSLAMAPSIFEEKVACV